MSDVIRTEQLTKIFKKHAAVYRLDLTVPAGAIFALLGDNGAGKSTTIRMLTGLLPADAGRAEVLGQDAWSAAVTLRHRIGYVPERPKFYDWMTVREIGWFTAGFHRAGYLDRYLGLAGQFGLDPAAKLSTLSKGGYAKVGLALALAIDPELLILDEPTSGLDLLTRREFLARMVDLAGAGRTVLISSHQIAEVERIASHVAFLAEGRLLLAAPLDELTGRFLRVQLHREGMLPDLPELGTVLEQRRTDRGLEVVLQDPMHEAIEALRQREGLVDVLAAPLTLEEIYTALLARYHRGSANGAGHSAAFTTAAAGRAAEEGVQP